MCENNNVDDGGVDGVNCDLGVNEYINLPLLTDDELEMKIAQISTVQRKSDRQNRASGKSRRR